MVSGNLPNRFATPLDHRLSGGRKKFWPVLLVIGLLILLITLWPRHSASQQAEVKNLSALALPALPGQLLPLPEVIAKPAKAYLQTGSAILVDGATGTVLYGENEEARLPIASTTKLITALIARERLDLDQKVTVSKEATSIIGSDMNLRTGEVMTVRGLLAGLLITSGNDAAYVLAETAAPSIPDFVALMNTKAAELGMKSTTYADPAGLDDAGRSTAHDLAVVARAALQDAIIAELVQTKQITIVSVDGQIRHDLSNSNRLVGEYNYLGAIGLKTGFTPEAGHCLVAGAERDGHQLIAVILHTDADTITASAIEARKLLDWGWTNVTWSEPVN